MTSASDRHAARANAGTGQEHGPERAPETHGSLDHEAANRPGGNGGAEPGQEAATAELGAGEYRLRAEVPDGIFSLAIEADEAIARAEHAAFADRCMPLLATGQGEPGEIRRALLQQLWAARQVVAAGGLGYLGVLAGELDGRARLLLPGIAAAPLEVPDGISPVSLLAALLRHHYPDAQVEDFPAAHGHGVGIRRCGELLLPAAGPEGEPVRIDTGISQALGPV
ncbi:MAG TPA: hypothetical protein VE733_19970 [Streptosporangiaceae bacterium]|nr:hypothetical protein [Streptosporangiaceae bacterium]